MYLRGVLVLLLLLLVVVVVVVLSAARQLAVGVLAGRGHMSDQLGRLWGKMQHDCPDV
jgi:hypothetical protein